MRVIDSTQRARATSQALPSTASRLQASPLRLLYLLDDRRETPGHTLMMASPFRSILLRQALAAPSKRRLTNRASSALPAFRAQLPRQQPILQSSVLQTATFQTSAQRAILPPLPQSIKGTVNDPVNVPDPEPSHGSYHWTAER